MLQWKDIWPFVQSSHAHCIWRERKKREGKRAVRSICMLGGSGLSCLTLTALVGFQLLSFSLSLCPSCIISHYPSCDDFKNLWNYSLFKTFFFWEPIAWFLFPPRLDLKSHFTHVTFRQSFMDRWRLSNAGSYDSCSDSNPLSVMGTFLRPNLTFKLISLIFCLVLSDSLYLSKPFVPLIFHCFPILLFMAITL